MIELFKPLYARLLAAVSDASLLGSEPWSDILTHFQEAIEAAEQVQETNVRKMNVVDRLGYGQNIIALQEGGLEIKEISQALSLRSSTPVSPRAIIDWLAEYNELSASERATRLNMDVNATRQQMQLLLERANDKLVEIEAKADSAFRRNSRDEVILQYLQEIRMIVKTAHDMQKHEELERTNKLFQQIALQVIERQCPAAAYEIYKQLKARHVLLGMGS